MEAILNFFLNGHLIEFVNSKIRQGLVVSGGGFSQVLPNTKCNTLQAAPHDPNKVDDDDVEWSEPVARLPQFTQTVTVRPLRVKRLRARQFDLATGTSGVLYEPVESPGFHFWAGFNRWFCQLPPMMEEQEVALTAPAIKAIPTLPGIDSLVVLASTEHRQTTDSNFVVFSQSRDYGNGIRKIVIRKTYFQPAVPPRKPMKMLVDAYEVTFEVFNPVPGSATF